VVREEMAGDAYGLDVLGNALTEDDVRDSVTARVRGVPAYEELFRRAYPEEIESAKDIRIDHIAKAIAAYERELVTPGSRYDRFVSGEFEAYTEAERRGFEVFFGNGLCGNCHRGPMLSDFTFHVQGVADDYDSVLPGFGGKDGEGHDFGRFHADPAEHADGKYAFRTLTIRNVERTAPYFHSGSAATLREVVVFYNRGGLGREDIPESALAEAGAVRDPAIRPLGLTGGDIEAVIAFMKTTTAEVAPGPGGMDLTEAPARVPSGLVPPGSATPPGSGPFLPEIPPEEDGL
jgi:cytochrome c peroxidase